MNNEVLVAIINNRPDFAIAQNRHWYRSKDYFYINNVEQKGAPMPQSTLNINDPAPDFTLQNQNGEAISLASFKGKKVLLSWHPLAFTPVCEIQMRTLEIKAADFEKLNAVALGLSVDAGPAKKAWAEQMGVAKTHLLADFWPHGGVTKQYGLFIEDKGISGRANILVDEQGKIEWIKVYEIPELPDVEEVFRHLKRG